jgi:hypothetical protein
MKVPSSQPPVRSLERERESERATYSDRSALLISRCGVADLIESSNTPMALEWRYVIATAGRRSTDINEHTKREAMTEGVRTTRQMGS